MIDLPFTRREFLEVFAGYNEAIWPYQIAATAVGVIAVALLFRRVSWADRTISAILAVIWATTGIGYHLLFFSSINEAAFLFGGLFIIGAVVFLIEGTVRGRIQFVVRADLGSWLAGMLVAYALVVYPLLSLFLTHPYPETPLFGVTPCPTTIFTLGLLIIARYPKPIALALVPLAWSAIGGMAALSLDVPQDWGLVVAALFWMAAPARRKGRPPRVAGA